ncbi:MAG: IS21-like element helper ATPase IstB [Solirubrobacteraceae bacterium]
MSAPAVALAPDLERALKRLKLRAVRQLAPEVLQTAKVQRWAPEELLRTLVEAEIAARDAANTRARLRVASFPVRKSLDEFKVAESAVPQATFDYLGSLEWVRAHENLVLCGPAGTGKSHLLVALGQAAVQAGLRVRYFAGIELVETLYRGQADNSVGRILAGLLRADLIICDELGFAPLDPVGSQLLFRVVAAAYERRSLAVASHFPFEEWSRFLPDTITATSLLDRLLHHATVVVTSGESFRMREARSRAAPRTKTAEARSASTPAKPTR